jgi:hypothetical protein
MMGGRGYNAGALKLLQEGHMEYIVDAGLGQKLKLVSHCDDALDYETTILQPIAYRIPRYASNKDKHWIHLGSVSTKYQKNADKSKLFLICIRPLWPINGYALVQLQPI